MLCWQFAPDVVFILQHDHFICSRNTTTIRVVISVRLKEIIDQQQWSECLPEDLEDIRSLQELGYLVESQFGQI
jgi:hypothetical protein